MTKTNYSKKAAKVFKKNTRRTDLHSLAFDLKASEKQKYANDGQWFKDYMEWIIPTSTETVEDYAEMKKAYEIINNDLSSFQDEISEFCNPLAIEDFKSLEKLEAYPKLYTKLNVLKGEFLKRGDHHKIVLLSAKAIKDKNRQFVEKIKASVEEEVALVIQAMQEDLEGMSEEQVQEFIETYRQQASPDDLAQKNFLSDWEIFNSKCLQYCYYDQDVLTKKMDTLEDCITVDRAFVYSGWEFGKPCLKVRNTLFTGFHKAPNEIFIHKGDYIWHRDPITIADVLNEYGDLLSDDDLDTLGVYTYGTNNKVDRRHDVIGGTAVPVFDHLNEELWKATVHNENHVADKKIGTNMASGGTKTPEHERLVWRTHFEFKAYRKMVFLSYKDEYNEQVTVVLDDKAMDMIPPDAEKVKKLNNYGNLVETYVWVDPVSEDQYEAMVLYVPRKYEVVRLGEDVYSLYREVPYQRTNINAPYSSFSLSTKGIVLNARNSKSKSLVQRSYPAYFEYLYVKKVQRDELSKYQGFIQSIDMDQIPDELGQDEDGNPIRDKLITYLMYLKKTNKDLYSGSQGSISGGLPPATRSPGSSGYYIGTAMELLNLQQLATLLDNEIGMSMGISPQREAQFSANSNVTDNQQAITQSHHITEPLFYLHNLLWKEALEDWLGNFRTYCEMQLAANPDSPYLIVQYIAPDGARELLEVTPELLSMQDIGLWVANTTQDQTYMQAMLQQIQTIGQNPESAETISLVVKGITSQASPEEVHRLIQVLAKEQRERAEAMEKAQAEREAAMQKYEEDMRRLEAQDKMDQIELGESLRKERELEVTELRYILDADRDGIPDMVEKYRVDVDKAINEAKLRLEEREIKRKELKDIRDAELKRKEIAAKKAGKK